jgi:hypothetical protein
MAKQMTEAANEKREAWAIEQFKANPKVGANTMKRLTREKFGAGIGFYRCRELKELALSKKKVSVTQSLKQDTVPVAKTDLSALFKEITKTYVKGLGDCRIELNVKDGDIKGTIQNGVFKTEFELTKEE